MFSEDYTRIADAIDFLEDQFQAQPNLKDVANHVGLSEYHFQRLFKRWAGISPKRFVQVLTADYAREMLQQTTMIDTTYAAGLSSPARLYQLTINVFAMSPAELKNGGEGLDIHYGVHDSPFGRCLLAVTERGICSMGFLNADEHPDKYLSEWQGATLHENAQRTQPLIDEIFGAHDEDHELSSPLLVKGTNFQVRVWEALLSIPHGGVATYEDIAEAIGKPSAARAVGNAVGSNNIAYLIPCHRVIRKSGRFGSYRWGSTRKRAILAWEASHLA